MKIDEIKTPAYVCELPKLLSNLALLSEISQKSGVKILCALKGFALSLALPYAQKYLSGATCSGLHEAKYAKEYFPNGEIHTYSPAYKDYEIDEILSLSNHIVFNSANEWLKFRQKALKSAASAGLRINPQISFSPVQKYNPCGKFSRFGLTRQNLSAALTQNPDFLDDIKGLHFHALCEESSENLALVLQHFEANFGKFLAHMKWVNFGGGHHITKDGYNVNLLVNLIQKFRTKFDVEVYLEPGEAIGWKCGYLVASVLDIVDNGRKIAILDTSAEAHMPDTVLMPYRPDVRGEVQNGKFEYFLGANSCLSGDIIGLESNNPVYKFDKELKIGDKIIFEDQIHYTIVKNTTFNGIKLPDLHLVSENGEILASKFFGYDDFRRRN